MPRTQDLGQAGGKPATAVEVARPQGDAHHTGVWRQARQQRELHLDAVLALMSQGVELEVGDRLGELAGQRGVRGHGRPGQGPDVVRGHRPLHSQAVMSGAEHDDHVGDDHARIDGGGDSSGEPQAGMRHHDRRPGFRLSVGTGQQPIDDARQVNGLSGIKRPRHRRGARSGAPLGARDIGDGERRLC